jgi:microcystin-dependent protein
MKTTAFLLLLASCFTLTAFTQNVGIGTDTPTEKLEVNGNIKATSVILTNSGSPHDFVTSKAGGEIGYKKGHGAMALNYIICINGSFPTPASAPAGPWLGEIKLFAGNFAPAGWAFCHGQLMSINQNTSLFSLLGTNYGGNGQTNFALPDLRGAVPVGQGTSTAGYQWTIGQKSD